MKYNILQEKSYAFSLNIIKICDVLKKSKEFILADQLLRSGTSVGANIEEAIGAYSTKEFPVKLAIAYKEARESKYWLKLLNDSSKLENHTSRKFLEDVEELLRIIGSIQLKLKSR